MTRFIRFIVLAMLVLCAVAKATINSTTCFAQYILSSNTQTLTVPYVFQNTGDLLVYDSKASPPVVLLQNSDYTVTGGAGSTGSITMQSGGQNNVQPGDVITIVRGVPLTQLTSFTNSGPLTAAMIGNALDKLTTITQQMSLIQGRSLQFQPDETLSGQLALSARKNTYLTFDGNGNIQLLPLGSGGGGGGSDLTNDIFLTTGSVSSRTLGARGADVTNVLDFGADKTGVNPSDTAISAAIAALPSGQSQLFFPPGTYTFAASHALPSGVSVLGYGAKLIAASQSDLTVFSLSGVVKVQIKGFVFDGLYTSGSGALANGMIQILNSSDVTVSDCHFQNLPQEAITVEGTSAHVSITQNEFFNFFTAIFTDYTSATAQPTYLLIDHNRFHDGWGGTAAYSGAIKISSYVTTSGATVSDLISNNIIINPGQMGIEVNGTGMSDGTISGNTIAGASFGISMAGGNVAGGVSHWSITGNEVSNWNYLGCEVAAGCTYIDFGNNTLNGSVTANHDAYSIVDCQYVTITGGSVLNKGDGVHIEDSGGAVSDIRITGVLLQFCSGMFEVKTATSVTIQNCTMVGDGTNTYSYIFLDTSDGPLNNVIIQGNTFLGASSQIGIGLYIPGTNPINALRILQNDTSAATFGAGGALQTTVGNTQTYIVGARCQGNISRLNGGIADYSNAFNVLSNTQSSAAMMPYNYFALEDAVIYLSGSGSGTIIYQLPPSTGLLGYRIRFLVTSSTEHWEIEVSGSDGIYGKSSGGSYQNNVANLTITGQGAYLELEADGGGGWAIDNAR